MSLFGSILGAVAGPVLGGLFQNQGASNQASSAMAYQTQMSNTSHQREVEDLKAAGLNPILSANSGASTPSGVAAPVADVISPAISSAMAAKRLDAELENMHASNEKIRSDTDANKSAVLLNKLLGVKAMADAQLSSNSAKNAAVNNAILNANLPAARNEAKFQTDLGSSAPWIRNTVQTLKDILGTAHSAKQLTTH